MLQRFTNMFPFSFEDEATSTLTRVLDGFGNWVFSLRPIYHDATTNPLAVTPNDPYFGSLWHLNGTYGINVQDVWDDYQGSGITLGFVDDGVQYAHPDLSAHYNTSIDYDLETNTGDGAPRTSSDNHGTTTSGVAGAGGNNGQGVTGVAYEVTEANFRLPFGTNLTDAQFATLYDKQFQAGVDVSNNSWGFGGFFGDDFAHTMPLLGASIENLAANGRGGLGTNIVFAAGNGRADGQNTNYHSMDNSQYVIAVAATDANGKFTSFSTPGASVLTSAPGSNITSTDRTGGSGYVNTDYVTGLAGTSYSSPIVAGVVSLMLDANPNLGYRDVQEILAYTSRNSDPSSAGWKTNGAGDWNGGGLHFSNDYGFGLVDAKAAVRLAETWGLQSTFANRDMVDSGNVVVNSSIPNNSAGGISRSVNVASGLDIDKVEVDLNITHTNIGDLTVTLTGPSGMASTLVSRPGYKGYGSGASDDNIHFTLSSNAFWGESGNGLWTVKVVDSYGSYTGSFTDFRIRLYGDTHTADNTYIYTNEYSEARAINSARGTLSDSGGVDTVNFAAVSSNTILDMNGGASTVDGAAFVIAAGTVIENARLGDGNDTAVGNTSDNFITGGRGDDSVAGGAGNDSLDGGNGNDRAVFSGSFAEYQISVIDSHQLLVADTVTAGGDDGSDSLADFERLLFGDGLYMFDGATVALVPPPPPPPPNAAPDAKDDSASLNKNTGVTLNVLSNDTDPETDALSVSGISVNPLHGGVVINANNTITYTPTANYTGGDSFTYSISDGHGNNDTATVTLTINDVDPNQNITGGAGNDLLNGGSGNDTIKGAAGSDTINGNNGNDSIDGGLASDKLFGNNGNDTLLGSNGSDTLDGGEGNDYLAGSYDNDYMIGGDGADTILGQQAMNTIIGGGGSDLLITDSSGTDKFFYNSLADAGDTIQGFWRGQDKLDLHGVMVEIGYAGTNPVGDGRLIFTPAAGGDLQVYVDTDGVGGNAAVLLLTLDNINATTLTKGTDYII